LTRSEVPSHLKLSSADLARSKARRACDVAKGTMLFKRTGV
jgi:hypothetical protein